MNETERWELRKSKSEAIMTITVFRSRSLTYGVDVALVLKAAAVRDFYVGYHCVSIHEPWGLDYTTLDVSV